MTKPARTITITVTSLMLLTLGGCILGNSTTLKQATIGQQLIDLDRAKTDGAITESEYERARSNILDGTYVAVN